MKIIQISTVIENYISTEAKPRPNLDATVYGLGDDGKVYYYGQVEKESDIRSKIDSMLNRDDSEDKETEKQWGWVPYGQ